MAVALAPVAKRLEPTLAVRRNRKIGLITGTESVTTSSKRKAIKRNTGGRAANISESFVKSRKVSGTTGSVYYICCTRRGSNTGLDRNNDAGIVLHIMNIIKQGIRHRL